MEWRTRRKPVPPLGVNKMKGSSAQKSFLSVRWGEQPGQEGIYGRVTLELRCLMYSSSAIWRCCWGFCARDFVRSQVAAQSPLGAHCASSRSSTGHGVMCTHPWEAQPSLAQPANSAFSLNLSKHDGKKKCSVGPSLFLMHSIECKQENGSCWFKNRLRSTLKLFCSALFFIRGKALYSVRVTGTCWTKCQTPTLGYFKSNTDMSFHKWESRGRKWVTVQKERMWREGK